MVLSVQNLKKQFIDPNGKVLDILKGINFSVEKGETLAIMGQSGSGKSTLLSLLGGLDYPSSGGVEIIGQNISKINEDKLAKFRAKNIGFIFQQFHLMPHLTAAENIALPLEMSKAKNINSRVEQALENIGLSKRGSHFPHQLSGGECQRIAIARAIVVEPTILLADEPTGNLDEKIGTTISTLLFDLVGKLNMTMILVTHNVELSESCDRTLHLSEGNLI